MSVPNTPAATPDPVAVRRAARALMRAAGYEQYGAVTYFSLYPDLLRVHTIGPDGRITKHTHKLTGDGMSWTER